MSKIEDLLRLAVPFVNGTQEFTNSEILKEFSKNNIQLEYIQFDEEELFPNMNRTYPLFPTLFFLKNSRDNKPVTKEEVSDLYWT